MTPQASPRPTYIKQVVAYLGEAGETMEVRILNTHQGTVSGYFNDPAKLAECVAEWDQKASGIYVTPNPVNPALLARSVNKLRGFAKQTTSDSDILQRRWFLVDFDPQRPAGISSTDNEHNLAIARAKEAQAWLEKLGWPDGILADSGNGSHLLYRLDLPNTPDSTMLVKRGLEALALQFSDDAVCVDLTTFNPARIWKLYGTTACKGDSTPERPHRSTKILSGPKAEAIKIVAVELLERLSAMAPEETKYSRGQESCRDHFNLDEWISTHGIEIALAGTWTQSGHKWILSQCPWNQEHTNRSAYVVQFATGAIAAGCYHNGCTGKTWHDLRDTIEPGWQNSSRSSKSSSPPEPLRRVLPPPDPYPVDALGDILAPAAQEMHEIIQSPMALCAQSLLAGASLAVQAHASVKIDGRVYPLSEYFLSVAESGERKTATDNAALGPHEKRQKDLRAEYESSIQGYDADYATWKKNREEILSSRDYGTREEKTKALLELGAEPQGPINGTLVTKEPTYEGLVKALADGFPSMGIFSNEGGRFVGGHGMNPDNRLKTASGLSELWDGAPISRTRGGDGNSLLYGRRLSLHLMVQPEISTLLLGDQLLLSQGLLSRCLVAYPESTIGNRPYKPINLLDAQGMRRYFARLSHILEQPLPLAENTRNELNPRELTLEPDAKHLWVGFHDYIEGLLRDGKALSPIKGLAAKGAEHCARLAGILAVVDDLQATTVKRRHIEAGMALAQYYLDEGLRLFNNSHDKPDLILAEKLLEWAQTLEGKTLYPQLVYQYGPSQIRDRETARKIICILEDHGLLVAIPDGQEIDGSHRKEAWRVAE